MLPCHQRLQPPSDRTCSEDSGINCCWDRLAGKKLFSRSVVLPHWLLTAVQRGKGSLQSVTTLLWLTGIAGVFCTGEERKKGKALEQSSHIVPVLNFANHLCMF